MRGELGNGTTSKVETHDRIKTEISNKSLVLGVVASWGRLAPPHPRIKDPNLHVVRHDH